MTAWSWAPGSYRPRVSERILVRRSSSAMATLDTGRIGCPWRRRWRSAATTCFSSTIAGMPAILARQPRTACGPMRALPRAPWQLARRWTRSASPTSASLWEHRSVARWRPSCRRRRSSSDRRSRPRSRSDGITTRTSLWSSRWSGTDIRWGCSWHEDVRAPLLVVVGTRDEIVPPELSLRVFEAAVEPKRWAEIPADGHNDEALLAGQDFVEEVSAFLDEWMR